MTRSTTKRVRLLYWTTTALFLLLQGWAAVQYFSEWSRLTDAILSLGYPLIFTKILGVAKLLGVVAIATGLFPTLKEWAYAGFTFDLCGAFASHLSAGDSLGRTLLPLGFFALLMASYLSWKQLTQQVGMRRRRHGFGLSRRDIESHA